MECRMSLPLCPSPFFLPEMWIKDREGTSLSSPEPRATSYKRWTERRKESGSLTFHSSSFTVPRLRNPSLLVKWEKQMLFLTRGYSENRAWGKGSVLVLSLQEWGGAVGHSRMRRRNMVTEQRTAHGLTQWHGGCLACASNCTRGMSLGRLDRYMFQNGLLKEEGEGIYPTPSHLLFLIVQ